MAKGSSAKIRGITIELNADTAGILDGLKDINKSLGETDRALKDTNKLLKFDGNNTALLTQQQEYLTKAIEQTEEKLKKEKEILEQLKNGPDSDKTVEQQKAMEREIEATTQKLNQYKPLSIGQASRISGVSPADISVLLVYMKQNKQ